MTVDLITAYALNLVVLVSFLVADIVVLARSPARSYFVYWVASMAVWVANLLVIIIVGGDGVGRWVATIIATASWSLVIASAQSLAGQPGRPLLASVVAFAVGAFGATYPQFVELPFWVRTISVAGVGPVAFVVAAIIVFRGTTSAVASATQRINSFVATGCLLIGLAWAARLAGIILVGDMETTGLTTVNAPNVISALVILPLYVLVNSFMILREIRSQVERRRDTEGRVMVDQNEYLRNRLDSQLSTGILDTLIQAEESFRQCIAAGDQMEPGDQQTLRSRIAECTRDLSLRNEMLRDSVEMEGLVESASFVERMHALLEISGAPRFSTDTTGFPERLVMSKSYAFWICYVVGTLAGDAPVSLALSSDPQDGRVGMVFSFTTDGYNRHIPSLSDAEIDTLFDRPRDPSLERLFVLARFVHAHFSGTLATTAFTDESPMLGVSVSFRPAAQS